MLPVENLPERSLSRPASGVKSGTGGQRIDRLMHWLLVTMSSFGDRMYAFVVKREVTVEVQSRPAGEHRRA